MQRSVISAVLIPLTRYSPTLECHHLSTNRGSWITVMPIWKNGTYLAKKRAEGKHYNVALSHATKKLVRTIYAMEKSGQAYTNAA